MPGQDAVAESWGEALDLGLHALDVSVAFGAPVGALLKGVEPRLDDFVNLVRRAAGGRGR